MTSRFPPPLRTAEACLPLSHLLARSGSGAQFGQFNLSKDHHLDTAVRALFKFEGCKEKIATTTASVQAQSRRSRLEEKSSMGTSGSPLLVKLSTILSSCDIVITA
jgi:hypothetical protein